MLTIRVVLPTKALPDVFQSPDMVVAETGSNYTEGTLILTVTSGLGLASVPGERFTAAVEALERALDPDLEVARAILATLEQAPAAAVAIRGRSSRPTCAARREPQTPVRFPAHRLAPAGAPVPRARCGRLLHPGEAQRDSH